MPLVAAKNAPDDHRAHQHALAQHPKTAALHKVAAHACSIAPKVNKHITRTGPADFLKAQEFPTTAAPAWLQVSSEWQLYQTQLSYQRGKTIPNSSSAPSALRRIRQIGRASCRERV